MSTLQPPIVGAIEAGGTKFVCAVGRGPGADIFARTRFSTGDDPVRLMHQVTDWLLEQQDGHGPLAALGVATFGPVDLDERSSTHGFITTTPKPGWQQADILGPLRQAFPGVPTGFDTDVNGAGLGESRWGAASGLEDFIYVTAGTGIGGGGMARGRLLHGLVHPEMGHMGLPCIDGDDFEGACPFHGRCWEGLCSGPAIAKRTGMPAESLPPDHPAWDLTIRYMAHALVNLTCVLSPRKIILGGSVRKAGRLGEEAFFEKLRIAFREILAGYIASPDLDAPGIRNFIVPPVLDDDAGVCGAIALAQASIKDNGQERSRRSPQFLNQPSIP
ncbi:ROK family protein [Luteolibacter arcticus]|uniref:fructokinase n=1 Tax=Luteolibacter arcticus TaxID=1581411 RepID=A0ABT3GSN4_9BACT|nr:ROK family protein [Luteolibacter arcticus]MCW1926505.1 ROK family protein [Luteolibacter arcticus]